MKTKTKFNFALGALSLAFAGGAYFWSAYQKRQRNEDLLSKAPDRVPEWGNDRRDRVDQASWESFPASDPPGWH